MPTLKPYQEKGRDFLAARTRALLADEPGVGKTAQVIAALDRINARSVLVVCPAIAKFHWENEFRKWSSHQCEVVILSYGQLEQRQLWERDARGARRFYEALVVDECHYTKNPMAARTRAVFGRGGCAYAARRIWCLSGTPAPNNPAELWVLLRAFGATAFEYADFIDRYCFTDVNGRIRGTRKMHLHEIKESLAPYMLRRTKRDVMRELGDIDIQSFAVPLSMAWTPESANLHEIHELTHELACRTDPEVYDLIQKRAKEFATLRRYLALAKAPAVAEHVRAGLENGLADKLIVFGYHTESLEMMHAASTDRRWLSLLITGATPAVKRGEIVAQFQRATKPAVLFLNLVAGGIAIDLSCCHQAVALELDWVPATNAQAFQRMHRHGQKHPITVRVATVPNTADEIVSRVVERKTRDLTELWSK